MENKKEPKNTFDPSGGKVNILSAMKEHTGKSSKVLLQTVDPGDEKCISDLRCIIEALRLEIKCMMEEQQKELLEHFNIQKSDMLLREATLHTQIDALKTDVENLTQKMTNLLQAESDRQKELRKLSIERLQLLEIINEIQKEKEREKCVHCSGNKRKVTNV